MRAIALTIFCAAALAQWAVPLSTIATHERVLSQGTRYLIPCSTPDPYDPLRGRFLTVSPEQSSVILTPQAAEKLDDDGGDRKLKNMQYGTFTVDENGVAKIEHLDSIPPDTPDFITVKPEWRFGARELQFKWPFSRFYVNEKIAPEADRWMKERLNSEQGVLAEIAVYHGRAALVDLISEGKSFRETLQEMAKEHK